MTPQSKRIFTIAIPTVLVFVALVLYNAFFHQEHSCFEKPSEQIVIVLDKTKPYTPIQKVRSIEPYFKEAVKSAKANAQIIVFEIGAEPTHPKEVWAGCRPDTNVNPLFADPQMANAKLASVMASIRSAVDSVLPGYPKAPIAESLDVIGRQPQLTVPLEAGTHVKVLIVSDMIQESPPIATSGKSFNTSLWGCAEATAPQGDEIERLQHMFREIEVEVVALRRDRRSSQAPPTNECLITFWQGVFQHLTWDPAI